MSDNVNEGTQSTQEAQTPTTEIVEEKGHPESVPYHKYIGVKEMLAKSETKLSSLEEQLKNSPSAEEHAKIKEALEAERAEKQKYLDELSVIKNRSIAEKKASLLSRGVPEEDIKDASEKELDVILKALGSAKPAPTRQLPDMGTGGGSSVPAGNPMELARQAYSKNN
jgi:hypothetical protein